MPTGTPPSAPPARRPKPGPPPLRKLALPVALAAIILASRHWDLGQAMLSYTKALKDDPNAAGWFLLIAAIYSAVGLPRQALCLAGGLVFGLLEGLTLATVGALAGNMLCFLWARYFSGESLRTRVTGLLLRRWPSAAHALKRFPFKTVLALRLMPVGSAILVTFASGLLGVPWRAFLGATLLGSLPQNLVFTLMGAGAHIGKGWQIGLALGLFILSGVLGASLVRRQAGPDGDNKA